MRNCKVPNHFYRETATNNDLTGESETKLLNYENILSSVHV